MLSAQPQNRAFQRARVSVLLTMFTYGIMVAQNLEISTTLPAQRLGQRQVGIQWREAAKKICKPVYYYEEMTISCMDVRSLAICSAPTTRQLKSKNSSIDIS